MPLLLLALPIVGQAQFDCTDMGSREMYDV
jgi:hypothetical protein